MSAPVESKRSQQEEKLEQLDNSFADMSLDISSQSAGDESDDRIPLEPLYKLCMKYYKDNIGKALSITYQEKTRLLALHKQVTCGKYKPETGQAPGFLDVVGNDRVQAWQALGDMTRENAMKEFVRVLHKCSPSLKPYIIAYRVKSEEEAKQKQLEAELKRKQEEEQRIREAAAAASQNGGSLQEQQEQQVRQALNQQTEAQFRSYAQSQFTGDLAKQDALIKQLQEQHFQQYVRQVYDLQMQQQRQQASQPQTTTTQNPSMQPSSLPPSADNAHLSQQSLSSLSTGASGDGSSTLNEQINGGATDQAAHGDILLQEASMWTQKDIITFKNTIKKESRMENHTDCIIKVGSGETVTIRVPTHENGNCLFWEFATDHYDLAFGVYFEWTSSTDGNVQVHISDSSDEDEDEVGAEDNKSDAEKGGDEVKKPRGPPIDEIIPIYRRDCQDQVYCGSHVYPGRGVYLLKFDNSYSLWRSKTLYYRVYYSR